jgi:hypothetical protein
MNIRSQLLLSLLAAILLFGFFSWPLYQHFSDGIPHASRRTEAEPVRMMVTGDHLQLLYHFWLPADWFAGGTRFGYDLYQFNLGDDDDRAFPKTDYFPFSALFAVLHFFVSQATAWNSASIFAIWLALFWLWRLLLVYRLTPAPAFALALAMVATPYQWACSFGGSPTGFAMMTVPMLFYGIELAVRKGAFAGGVLSALALLSAFWTDTHVLLFSFLLGPLWVVLVTVHDGRFPWAGWKERFARITALMPLLFMALIAMFLRLRTKQRFDDESVVGGGWSWEVLGNFSPSPRGLYLWQSMRHDYHIYLGFLLLALVAVSIVIGAVMLVRQRRWHRLLHLVLLSGGLVVMLAFAFGTNGPHGGFVLHAARRLLPPITMMRQTAKIFAMLAPVLAVLLVPLWRWIAGQPFRPVWLRTAIPFALAGLVLLDWRMQVRPGISLLNTEQGAYAAVAADAEEPRAVVVPLWPGDSAWASLYQHNVSLYRLRMLNGYSPVVGKDYIEEVFAPLMSINSGVLTDEQIAFLEAMNVRYVLFHQDAFPEQVSWFPVGATLQKFLYHPRLELLRQDHNIWAFRILETPRAVTAERPWTLFGSRFQPDFSFERPPAGGAVVEDETAAFGRFMRLEQADATVALRMVDQHEMQAPRLLVRVRGDARWEWGVEQCGVEEWQPMQTETADWIWVDMPLDWQPDCTTWRARFRLLEGTLDLDMASYTEGEPPRLEVGESILIPAPTFYHAGYTDLERDAVVLRPVYEAAARIFYGPRWVVPDGRYAAELVWAEPAPAAEAYVGRLEIKLNHERVEAAVEVFGADHEPLVFSTVPVNLPLEFGLHYARETEVAIRGIRLTRLE